MNFSFNSANGEVEKPFQDFTLKINQQRIRCNRKIVQQFSPVLSNYISSHPNAKGCSCDLQKVPHEFDQSLISDLFTGNEIEINNLNFDLLMGISKGLKLKQLYESLSLFRSSDFPEEIKIEKMLLNLAPNNITQNSQSLSVLINDNKKKKNFIFTISHIFFGVCICRHQKIELLVDLLEKVSCKDLSDSFIHILLNEKRTRTLFGKKKAKSNFESEVNFILHKLFERNMIDKITIQTIRDIPVNFSDVFPNAVVQIDEERVKKYANEGINPNLIAVSLRKDDVETFSQISEFTGEFNQKFDRSPFERCELVNNECYLIEFAAFFRSVKCFKYLCDKYPVLPFNLAKFAVAGGCREIIKICEEKNCLFDNSLSIAIQYHHQKVVEWLVNDKKQKVTRHNVKDCIEFANYTALKFFLSVKVISSQTDSSDLINNEIFLRDNLKSAVKYNVFSLIQKLYSVFINEKPSKANKQMEEEEEEEEEEEAKEIGNPDDDVKSSSSFPINERKYLKNKKKSEMNNLKKQNKKLDSKEKLIEVASLYGNYESFEFLITNYDEKSIFLGKNKDEIAQNEFNDCPALSNEFLIVSAIKGGNIKIIKSFNYTSFSQEMFQKCLFISSKINSLDVIKFIHSSIIKIDLEVKKEAKNKTVLYTASKYGNFSVVDFLLQTGANVNSLNGKQGKTPLIIACEKGKIETVKTILRFKPDLNQKTQKTLQTPLHFACIFGNLEIVECLMYKSTPPSPKGKTPLSPKSNSNSRAFSSPYGSSSSPSSLMNSTEKQTTNREDLIPSSVCANLRDVRNRTPMHIACENNSIDIVSLLLSSCQQSLLVKTLDENMTPIEIAVKNGSIDIVTMFLEKEQQMAQQVITSEMLFTAVYLDNTEMVKLLLKQKKVYLNNRSKVNGLTALSQAVFNSNNEIIKILLKQNLIDINAKNSDGSTALHIAARAGKTSIFELLLKQEFIDINIKDRNGETPLHYACVEGHFEEVKILLDQPEIEDYNVNKNGVFFFDFLNHRKYLFYC